MAKKVTIGEEIDDCANSSKNDDNDNITNDMSVQHDDETSYGSPIEPDDLPLSQDTACSSSSQPPQQEAASTSTSESSDFTTEESSSSPATGDADCGSSNIPKKQQTEQESSRRFCCGSTMWKG